jgi:glycosyltransferase involved in cell wall biosynthesis
MVDVSVIIPAYNAEHTIVRAVDSVLKQKDVEAEALVIDDCSLDGTARVIEEHYRGNNRVKLLSTSANSGPSSARNVGIAQASGEWLALLDADDWFVDNRLSVLVRVASRSGVDFIADSYFLCRNHNETPHAERFAGFSPHGKSVEIDFATFIKYGMGSVKPVIRRALLDKTGVRFDPAVWRGEDMKFFATLLIENARFELVNTPMYCKQETPGSLTKVCKIRLLQDMRLVFAALEEIVSIDDPLKKDMSKAIMYRCRVVDDALAFAKLNAWVRRGFVVQWPGWEALPRALRHALFRRWRFP